MQCVITLKEIIKMMPKLLCNNASVNKTCDWFPSMLVLPSSKHDCNIDKPKPDLFTLKLTIWNPEEFTGNTFSHNFASNF